MFLKSGISLPGASPLHKMVFPLRSLKGIDFLYVYVFKRGFPVVVE